MSWLLIVALGAASSPTPIAVYTDEKMCFAARDMYVGQIAVKANPEGFGACIVIPPQTKIIGMK